MEILDLVEGKPADNGHLDKTNFMNLRRLQPREKLTNVQAKPASGYQPAIDNLIHGLVDLLPKSDGIWPIEDRAKWLQLAAGMFDLGYKTGDDNHKKISIAVVQTDDKP
jgi:hypothetical protein